MDRQTLKLVKTWIPYSTPSFILREVKGLRGHLSKTFLWITDESRSPPFPSSPTLIKFFVFPSSLLNVHFATRYFACPWKTLISLSLAWHFLFFGKGPYARSYAWDEQISPPSLVCKQNSSHLHSFWVGLGKKFKSISSFLAKEKAGNALWILSSWGGFFICT